MTRVQKVQPGAEGATRPNLSTYAGIEIKIGSACTFCTRCTRQRQGAHAVIARGAPERLRPEPRGVPNA